MKRKLTIIIMLGFASVFLLGCDLFGGSTTTTAITVVTTTAETTTATTATTATATTTVTTTVTTTATTTATTTVVTTVVTYDIIFNSMGGSVVSDGQYVEGVTTVLPEQTKAGYTFEGWYLSDSYETEFISTSIPTADITLYAKWEINEYMITFESNSGSAVTAITQDYLTTVTEPTEPTRLGYSFVDWYSDIDLTTAYTFTTIPLENITLYAKWEINEYMITFESNQGTPVTAITQNYLTTVIEPTEPTKEGYTFIDWYSDSGLTIAYTFTTMPADDITLYAKWEINEFTITFESNLGSAVTAITQDYLTTVTEPVEPTRVGYTFIDWYEESALTTAYTFTTMSAEDITLYAKWEINEYMITFESNLGSAVTTLAQDFETTVTEPVEPTKEGYAFIDWYSDVELATAYVFTTMPAEDITLYAKWEINEYTITFESNLGLAVTALTQDYLTTVTEPVETTRVGYTFIDWYEESALTTAYTFTTMSAEDITLYAKWEINEYMITFESNLGSTVTALTQDFGTVVTEPVKPTKEGYTFIDWFSDNGLTTVYTFTSMPAEDVTLYAKWVGLPSTISFETYAASDIDDLNVLTGDLFGLPTPVLEGYDFMSWYTSNTFETEFTSNVVPYGNLTLYAKFEIIQYSISFQTNGGNVISVQIYDYNELITLPDNPIKTTNIFGGWFTDSLLTNEFVLTNMSSNDLILYAKWIEVADPSLVYNQVNQADGSPAEIAGTVYGIFGSDYPGYFIFDETGYVFILGDHTGINIGDFIEVSGELDFISGVPLIINITETVIGSSDNPTKTPINLSFDGLNDIVDVDNYIHNIFSTEGIFYLDDGTYMLADPVTLQKIPVYNKSYESDKSFMMTVGVLNRVDMTYALVWVDDHFEAAIIGLTIIPMTDIEVQMIIRDLINTEFNGMEFIPGNSFEIPASDPFGFSTITYQAINDNASFYDSVNKIFLETSEIKTISFEVTATIDSNPYLFTINVILNAVTITPIADFLNGVVGDEYLIQGIVVSSTEMGDVIIKDDTGSVFVFNQFDLQIGDEVLLNVRKDMLGNQVYLDALDGDVSLVEILSQENDLGNAPVLMTLTEFLALDPLDPAIYGKYIEIRGFLLPEGIGYQSGYNLVVDDLHLGVNPFTYSGFEKLMNYGYLEVIIKGYIDDDEEGNLILDYEGIRQDVEIPEYTDSELVEVIKKLLLYQLEGKTFDSLQNFYLYTYHPVLGASVSWVLDTATADVYDMENQRFDVVFDTDVNLSFTITITKELESVTFVYDSVLKHSVITDIVDLKQNDAYGDYFVKGLVAYWHPDYLYLMDTLGNLIFVDISIPEVKLGDEIILYVAWNKNYQGAEVYLSEIYNMDETLITILSRDNAVSIPITTLDFADVLDQDSKDCGSFTNYVEITGRIYSISGSNMALVTPDGIIIIDYSDYYTYQDLALIDKSTVTLRGFISSYAYDNNFSEYLWVMKYVGMTGDIVKHDYTDQEKIDLVEAYIMDNYQTSVIGGEYFDFETITEMFPAVTITMTDIVDPNDLISFASGYNIQTGETLVDSIVEIQVDLDSYGTLKTFTFNFTVEAPLTIVITDIENIIFDSALDYIVEGMVISVTRVSDDNYYLMINDETGFIFVKVDYATYNDLYDYGLGYIGDVLRVSGEAVTNGGRPELVFGCWEAISRNNPVSVTFTDMLASDINALDLLDSSIYGQAISITGVLERVTNGSYAMYYINDGVDRVLISNVDTWYGILNYYTGYIVTLNGFVFGTNSLYDNSDLSLMFVDFDYSSLASITLGSYSEQEATDLAMAYIINKIHEYNPMLNPGEWGSFPSLPFVLTDAFPDLVVEFEFLNGAEYVNYNGGYYETLIAPNDIDLLIQVTVSCNLAEAVTTYTTRLNGFAIGTLNDLFENLPGTNEIALEATVIISGWGYYYLLIDNQIYYLSAYTHSWVNSGDGVLVIGKKTVIDNIPDYTYDVMLVSKTSGNVINLLPVQIAITDIYTNDYDINPIQRDYLSIYGKLGFDSFAQMFTLEYNGEMIYIRTELYSWEGPSALFDFVGEYVDVLCMVPMEYYRGEYLILDSIGTYDEVILPTETAENHVAIAKEKLLDQFVDFDIFAGDSLGILPDYDNNHNVGITYELVNGSDSVYVDIDGFLTNYTDVPISVDILVTFLYADGVTTDTATITVNINPRTTSLIEDVIWAAGEDTYQVEGLIVVLNTNDDGDYLSMIIKDNDYEIYVDLASMASVTFAADSIALSVGDYVRLIAIRGALDVNNIVSMLETPVFIEVLTSDNLFFYPSVTMTFADILALDYLDPDMLYQYVTITGTVTWNYNSSNPIFYLENDNYYDQNTGSYYSIKLIIPNTAVVENDLTSTVGLEYEVSGYLIGYIDIDAAFSWMLYFESGATPS